MQHLTINIDSKELHLAPNVKRVFVKRSFTHSALCSRTTFTLKYLI